MQFEIWIGKPTTVPSRIRVEAPGHLRGGVLLATASKHARKKLRQRALICFMDNKVVCIFRPWLQFSLVLIIAQSSGEVNFLLNVGNIISCILEFLSVLPAFCSIFRGVVLFLADSPFRIHEISDLKPSSRAWSNAKVHEVRGIQNRPSTRGALKRQRIWSIAR